ncbi:RNA-binding protein [Halobacillus sp. Marseille-Q1614]|uniref:YlmH family RNA-binding protein n=1 Tax=Halobacillus sp. Marseille-Q1614 TaxID=2709134 RepID=UPI00156D43A7|nr:YlmH/Sll1252 family protein [Halobacillus sp. Marseille-Q1614]
MEIYQHFREEERPFIDQMLSLQSDVEMRFERKETDFLNPREQQILKSVMGTHPDLKWSLSGGPHNAERKRAIIAPEYEMIEEEDFSLTLLEAEYAEKFLTIEHRDVLGSFMALGIKREKLGDLVVKEGKIHIVTASEISDYIRMNFTSIKNANVQFSEKPLDEIMESDETWKFKDSTISSLRLDVVVKEIYGVSRKKAAMFIEAQHVKVNFRTVDNPAFIVEEGDLISVRGKGRSQLSVIHGRTKKDKYKVTTGQLN